MAGQRLNLLLPDKTRTQLDDIRDRTNAANITEVIRRALDMYDYVTEQLDAGTEVVLRDPKGKKEPTLIPPWW